MENIVCFWRLPPGECNRAARANCTPAVERRSTVNVLSIRSVKGRYHAAEKSVMPQRLKHEWAP